MLLLRRCCHSTLPNSSLLQSSTTLPTRSCRKRRSVSFLQVWRYIGSIRRVPCSRWWAICGCQRSYLALACWSIILGTPGRGSLIAFPRNVSKCDCAFYIFSSEYCRLCELDRDANVRRDGVPRHCLCGWPLSAEAHSTGRTTVVWSNCHRSGRLVRLILGRPKLTLMEVAILGASRGSHEGGELPRAMTYGNLVLVDQERT